MSQGRRLYTVSLSTDTPEPPLLTPDGRAQLLANYRDGLLDDTLRFWFPRAVDTECGGFLHCFDQDGSVVDTDKSVWAQGRMAWMLATLYNTVIARNLLLNC